MATGNKEKFREHSVNFVRRSLHFERGSESEISSCVMMNKQFFGESLYI